MAYGFGYSIHRFLFHFFRLLSLPCSVLFVGHIALLSSCLVSLFLAPPLLLSILYSSTMSTLLPVNSAPSHSTPFRSIPRRSALPPHLSAPLIYSARPYTSPLSLVYFARPLSVPSSATPFVPLPIYPLFPTALSSSGIPARSSSLPTVPPIPFFCLSSSFSSLPHHIFWKLIISIKVDRQTFKGVVYKSNSDHNPESAFPDEEVMINFATAVQSAHSSNSRASASVNNNTNKPKVYPAKKMVARGKE